MLSRADSVAYAIGTNGAAYEPAILHALSDATIGNPQFGFACSRAPRNSIGALLVALLPAPGVPVLGIDLWIDPSSLLISVTVTSNAQGVSLLPVPYPAFVLPTFYTQYVWIENPTLPTLSASDALRVH